MRLFLEYFVDGKIKKIFCGLENQFEDESLKIGFLMTELLPGIRVNVTLFPKKEIEIQKLFLEERVFFSKDDKVFINGYQSWTESREFGVFEKLPPLSLIFKPFYSKHQLSKFGDYTFFKYSRKKGVFHSYTYTYIRRESGKIQFYGSLSEKNGFTIFHYFTKRNILRIIKECSNLKANSDYEAFDILITHGEENDVFCQYFNLLNLKRPTVRPCTGWTSWYNYYTKISEKIILSNLKAFVDKKIPIDLFQIDDGYQKAVGDWLMPNENFPSGMKYIADEIKKAGFKAGIWLAPFICDTRSEIFKNHKDWILKDKNGNLVMGGANLWNWGGPFYVLDFYNQEVLEYLREVFHTILNEWGFDMVKLDFLYAVCLLPRENKTRAQIMYEAMNFLRETAGDKIILGCGVPLASAFGLVDYCRIGSDIHLSWEHKEGAIINYRERISTINAIVNTINRRHLDGNVFYNDPDVFILRRENNQLKEEMRHTLLVINLIFGSVLFTSDNIDSYSEKEMALYLSISPLKQKKIESVKILPYYKWKPRTSILGFLFGIKPYEAVYRVDFEIDDKQYICVTNLGCKSIDINLEDGFYYNNYEDCFVEGGKPIILKPYSTRCYLKSKKKDFELLGSTGHLFAGCDVELFSMENKNIRLEVCKNPARKSKVYIRIPAGFDGYMVNGKYVECYIKNKDFNVLRVNFS